MIKVKVAVTDRDDVVVKDASADSEGGLLEKERVLLWKFVLMRDGM